MLTARDTVGDRVTGLDAGADDYLVKPFAYEELAARLRALGRRGQAGRRPEPQLVAGPIVLDETSRRVTLDGRTIDLSPREFSLLECLLRHPGQTLSRDQLLDQAWPFSVAVTPNAVDAYVHYLRDKLGARRPADRDRPRRGLSSGRCLTGSCHRPTTTAPEPAAETADGRLIRHVRQNLVLWSGGTTLLVLVVLGAALYAAVAGSLASAGTAQLDARMSQIRGVRPDPHDETRLRLHLRRRRASGTFALVVEPTAARWSRGPRIGQTAARSAVRRRAWPPRRSRGRDVRTAIAGRHARSGS